VSHFVVTSMKVLPDFWLHMSYVNHSTWHSSGFQMVPRGVSVEGIQPLQLALDEPDCGLRLTIKAAADLFDLSLCWSIRVYRILERETLIPRDELVPHHIEVEIYSDVPEFKIWRGSEAEKEFRKQKQTRHSKGTSSSRPANQRSHRSGQPRAKAQQARLRGNLLEAADGDANLGAGDPAAIIAAGVDMSDDSDGIAAGLPSHDAEVSEAGLDQLDEAERASVDLDELNGDLSQSAESLEPDLFYDFDDFQLGDKWLESCSEVIDAKVDHDTAETLSAPPLPPPLGMPPPESECEQTLVGHGVADAEIIVDGAVNANIDKASSGNSSDSTSSSSSSSSSSDSSCEAEPDGESHIVVGGSFGSAGAEVCLVEGAGGEIKQQHDNIEIEGSLAEGAANHVPGKAAAVVKEDVFRVPALGELRFNGRMNNITACCSFPGHGSGAIAKCRKVRTCNPASSSSSAGRNGQGRPIGLLMTWLRNPETHADSSWKPSHDERLQSRTFFYTCPGSQEFAAHERDLGPGETEEPELIS
jgi:hypothetical protein